MFPEFASCFGIESDELLSTGIEGDEFPLGAFGVDEGEADGDDFKGESGIARDEAGTNWFIEREDVAGAGPEERGEFDDFMEAGDEVAGLEILAGDTGRDGGWDFGGGFHDWMGPGGRGLVEA